MFIPIITKSVVLYERTTGYNYKKMWNVILRLFAPRAPWFAHFENFQSKIKIALYVETITIIKKSSKQPLNVLL